MNIRRYDPDRDRSALWALKRSFERELAGEVAGATTRSAYEAKLTDRYRERYLDWVDRCVGESSGCLTVGEATEALVGYAFLLPESLSLIWDAAVLNEIYVEPDHRASGLADGLLEEVLEAARGQSLPMDRIVLDVAPINERARSFYRRHGFESWGTLVARKL